MTAPSTHAAVGSVRLGLRENLGQFSLLVLINAFVGAISHAARRDRRCRPSVVACIRSWRLSPLACLGYAIGAVLAGVTADAFGLAAAMWVIAALTFVSGAVSATRMAETLPAGLRTTPRAQNESRTPMPGSQPHLAVDTRRPE